MQEGRFAGVDRASEEHAACVVSENGRILEGRRYGHDERGIAALCDRLLKLKVTQGGSSVRMAADRPAPRCRAVGDRRSSQPGCADAPPFQRRGRQER